MRLSIECVLDKKEITISYNRKILSFFKKSLENYNKDIKESFYGEDKEKDMSFSCFFLIEKIEKNILKLKLEKFKIFLTFNSLVEGIHYYNAFIKAQKESMKFFVEDGNSFTVENIVKLNEKNIEKNVAIFKTMSPVVIREKRDNMSDWYHFLDKKGVEVLKKNLSFNLRDRFSEAMLNEIEIIPIDIKKTVVKFYEIQFTATRGIFGIRGNKELLNYFYKSGIASRKSSGFGMLELIN
ncbi:CRISPR-associated endoribonuclease Cas6 [Fusobacterium sp.]|uniref:CRISPR-associated endoribonuclease Cas6 n=1 Tax=Fusobacterium sp. TaxID=68766 RepID=UPI00396CB6B8